MGCSYNYQQRIRVDALARRPGQCPLVGQTDELYRLLRLLACQSFLSLPPNGKIPSPQKVCCVLLFLPLLDAVCSARTFDHLSARVWEVDSTAFATIVPAVDQIVAQALKQYVRLTRSPRCLLDHNLLVWQSSCQAARKVVSPTHNTTSCSRTVAILI